MPKLLQERIAEERQFHDEQANQRSKTFSMHPERLLFTDDEYLDHVSWIRSGYQSLGSIAGQSILDYGCGHGMASIVLARGGARVSAFDLSAGYIEEARRRAEANRVEISFSVSSAEELPYQDNSFDAVWGNAILHHTELPLAAKELDRILKPGGLAVFHEPWGGNPFLNFARKYLPYSGKGHTEDENAFTETELAVLEAVFPEIETTGHQLLSMVSRVAPIRLVQHGFQAVDNRLLKLIPRLKTWCRYMTIVLRKPAAS